MQRVTPFLWFDNEAEEAASFYVSVFRNARIEAVSRYTDAMPSRAGQVMTVAFELDGQRFTALNGGAQFKFNEAVSFVVSCKSQAEVDHYWKALAAGGEERPCGWLRDKYGMSWQIVPDRLMELVTGDDKAKAQRVMTAMFEMSKIDIAALEVAAAAEG